MKTIIKNTKTMGRGVFAAVSFKKGARVEVSYCLTWDRDSDKAIQDSDLKFYVFSDNRRGSVLALGNGSLFNHSTEANVTYRYVPLARRMIFTASRRIKKGEQLFIDYGYDPVAKHKAYDRARLMKLREQDEEKKQLESDLLTRGFDGHSLSYHDAGDKTGSGYELVAETPEVRVYKPTEAQCPVVAAYEEAKLKVVDNRWELIESGTKAWIDAFHQINRNRGMAGLDLLTWQGALQLGIDVTKNDYATKSGEPVAKIPTKAEVDALVSNSSGIVLEKGSQMDKVLTEAFKKNNYIDPDANYTNRFVEPELRPFWDVESPERKAWVNLKTKIKSWFK